ncbi:DUF3862 domain-containing protein [Agrilactobacillus fermenti]|uniref:DUF3862 domain-containing protein n=1 Tax=Agrilactobacillus fermenti TaxID=2586909 RepID=UPI002E7AC948|nr:DUF3862 domain-containing protein [Agrilactobacillus fermenti]
MTLGDFSKMGTGGVTLNDLTAKYGKPDNTSSVKQNDQNTTIATWNRMANQANATVSVGFVQNKAFSKSLNDYQVERKDPITIAQFNQLQTGADADAALNTLGLPNQVNMITISGSTQATYTYDKAMKPTNAKIVLTFMNNKLQGKTQHGLD